MGQMFYINIRGRLGLQKHDGKEMRLLNRIICWHAHGNSWEADRGHAEIIMRELQLSNTQPVVTPGTNTKWNEENDENLNAAQASKYKQLVARANSTSLGRTDLHLPVKELSRDMARPKQSPWQHLLMLGEFLVGRPRLVVQFPHQRWTTSVNNQVDADWAGEVSPRNPQRRDNSIG